MKKVQLFIEDKEIDLFGNEAFSLTFTINDITDISTKASSFSQDVNLPATENNNRVFTSLFDVTTEGGFNPISKKRAVLFADNMPLMRGFFQLNSINIRDNKFVTYNGLLVEEQVQFINVLNELTLSNLSIPLTGTSTQLAPPFTAKTTFEITGFSYNKIATQASRFKVLDGINYSGVTFGSGSYGSVIQQNRSYHGIPPSITWTPATMGSYKASSPQVLEVNINFDFSATTYAEFFYRIFKSDFNTPSVGLFTDTIIGYGVISGTPPDPINNISTAKLQITNLTVPLLTNDTFRIELYSTTSNATTFDTSTAYIKGNVLEGLSAVTNNLTINPATMLKNISEVEDADDATIVYPLIDYSNLYQIKENRNLLSNVVKELNIDIEDLRPWVFVKHVWDAIFKQAGFKYQSNFLNDTLFKSLIIGGGISDDEIGSLVYHTVPNTSATLTLNLENTRDVQTLNSNKEVISYEYKHIHMGDFSIEATGGTANTFTSIVQIDQYSTYAPSSKVENAKVHQVNSSTSGGFSNYYGYQLTGTSKPYGVFMTSSNDGKYQVDAKFSFTSSAPVYLTSAETFETRFILQLQKLSIGSYKYFPNTHTAPTYNNWRIVSQSEVRRAANTSAQTHSLIINEEFTAKKGDIYRVILIGDPNLQGFGITSGIKQEITINSGDTYCKFYRKGNVLYGNYDDASVFLPRDINQKDFILGISKMFNLYFEADKQDPKKLIIEPRDTYYELGRIINLENKIDKSKDFNISILSHEFPKNNIFKWAEDSDDYFSQKYKLLTENKLQFGSYKYTSPNEYVSDEKTLESIFAPSYLAPVDENSNLYITKIINPTTQEPGYDGGEIQYEIKPRIIAYKKKDFNTPNYSILLGTSVTNTNYVPFKLGSFNPNSAGVNYPMTIYGYAGHLSDPQAPVFDINWYTDFNYLPNLTGETENNLFNIAYKNELIELTDQTARKVKCFVNLNSNDIINLRFCDIFYFEKEYWRLIEIRNFNTSSDIQQTTECTFIKLVRAKTNELIDYSAFGYLGLAGGTGGGILGGELVNGNGFGIESGEKPKIRINNGTLEKDIDSQNEYYDEINKKNNIKVDIAISGNPILRPKTIFNTQQVMDTVRSLNETKDVTLNIQSNIDLISSNINLNGNIYEIDNSLPQGTIYTLNNTYDRVFISSGSYTATTSYVVLPPAKVINDNYSIKFVGANSTAFKTNIIYFDTDGVRKSLLATVTPTNPIELSYWQDVDDMILVEGTITSGETQNLIYFGGNYNSGNSLYQYNRSNNTLNWDEDAFSSGNTQFIINDEKGSVIVVGSGDTSSLKIYDTYGNEKLSKDFNTTIRSAYVEDNFIYICGNKDVNDMTHRKVSYDGYVLWENSYGDDAYSIVTLGDYVYVVGKYYNSANIRKYDKSTGLFVSESALGTADLKSIVTDGTYLYLGGVYASGANLFKVDTEFNLITSYNNTSTINSIDVDSSGNVYLASDTTTDNYTARKLDSSLNVTWSYNHGANCNGVFVDADGNVYVVGSSSGGTTARKLNNSGAVTQSYNIGTTLNCVSVK